MAKPSTGRTRAERGGRPAGSLNKVTAELKRAAAASGELPLTFLLRIMRSKRETMDRRMAAATAAAPYVHSKMPTSIQHSGSVNLTHEQALRQLADEDAATASVTTH